MTWKNIIAVKYDQCAKPGELVVFDLSIMLLYSCWVYTIKSTSWSVDINDKGRNWIKNILLYPKVGSFWNTWHFVCHNRPWVIKLSRSTVGLGKPSMIFCINVPFLGSFKVDQDASGVDLALTLMVDSWLAWPIVVLVVDHGLLRSTLLILYRL